MDSTYLQEIQVIIQKDIIQSTYKLALLRAIIEIAQESNGSKVVLNGMCAYPFSLLQRKLLTYYYPLFAHPSFIPQMRRESPVSRNGRQLVIRTSMNPIIQYYHSNGGYEGLLSDLEKNHIPGEIATDYSRFLETIRRTFIAQPMKYLGNSIRPEGYTVVKYLTRLPPNGSMLLTSPADLEGYYAISQEYARIFEEPSCAQHLLDLVVRRWIDYTLSLSDTLTHEELYGLFAPVSHTGIDVIELHPSPKPAISLPLPAPISTRFEKSISSRESQANPASMILALEEAIRAEYSQFSSQQQSIQDGTDAVLKAELRSQKIDESIRRIEALYGISSQGSVLQGPFEVLSHYYADQQAAQDAYSGTMTHLLASKRKLSELKRERDRLQQMAQKVTRSLTVRKRQQDLIDRLHHELALLDDGSDVQPRPFGYIDKPIARFLTYCGDVTLDILGQCIRLIPDPEETTMVKPALPAWFIDEFDTWRIRKQEMQKSSRESGSGKSSTHRPFITFDEHHREVQLTIPSQVIERSEGLDHVALIIHDGSQILHEEELPLYHADEGLATEENTVRVERPSQHYHVELSAPGVSSTWVIDGSGNSDALCLFDYETGRRIEQQRIPPKRFILLTRSEPTITPEEAVLFTGRLSGDWYDFKYYDIDPVDGLVIGGPQALSGEDGREPVKLDLRIDPGYFDRYLRVDGWSVIPGSPPCIQILFADKGVLSSTTLSIHPRGRDPTLKPTFHSLGEPGEGVEIDPDGHICTVDLGHSNLLGRERAGAFTIRVYNESCRTDIRVECVFLPGISYRFSKPLYLPAEGASPVQLDITCPSSVRFEPDGPVKMDRTEAGFLITANLVPAIRGKLWYPAGDGSAFAGILSISVPHAAWRFEDEATGTIYPLRRSVPVIPDIDYRSLGTEPGLRVFLPESFSGTGTISVLPQNQTVTCRVVKGQGYFSLARFNDTLRATDAKCMHFEFSMEEPRDGGIRFPLFSLQRWYIHLPNPPRVSIDPSGNRSIEIEWEEYGIAPKRVLLLWRKKKSGGTSRIYVEEIPPAVRKLTIQGDHDLPLSPGIYYLQFYRILNDWDLPPASFGERAPNVFPLRIEQSKDRISDEQPPESGGDVPGSSELPKLDAGIERLIDEIESGDPERLTQALRDLKEDYSIRRINHHLLEKYPAQYERLQAALFAVIMDARIPQEVRFTSVVLLGKSFNQEREHTLITVLGSPDSAKDLRIAILKALGHGNTDECLNALLTTRDDPDPDIRVELAASLGNIDNKDAVKPLIALLDDESVVVQRKAAASLGYTRSQAASGLLVSIAFDEKRDTVLRITAISALAKFRLNEQTTRELFTLSKKAGEDEEVRKIATSVLSIQGRLNVEEKKRHIADLIRDVKTSSHGKRLSAIKQLSAFGDEEVILALMEATQDESVDVRRVAADSLRRINKPMAIPTLIELCDDPDDDIRETAEFACRQLLEVLKSDLKQTSDKRATAAGHLSRIGALAVNPLLVMLRKSESIRSERADSGEIQNSIVDALSRMNDPDAIALMIRALQDKNDLVVWGAAKALGAIGDASAIGPLKEALARWYNPMRCMTPTTYVWMEIERALQRLNG